VAIHKQEFYEGAALHKLACAGGVDRIIRESPFFRVNDALLIHLKYSTRVRSPWGFTFAPDELLLLASKASANTLVIGLICGSDGIVTVHHAELERIARNRQISAHVACYRGHGEHYEVNGPDGTLGNKVAPSAWLRILKE
jgi:hypothetical protein